MFLNTFLGFLAYDKDFLKTPMDLETVRLRASKKPNQQLSSENSLLNETIFDEFNSISNYEKNGKMIKVHENDRLLMGIFKIKLFFLNFFIF